MLPLDCMPLWGREGTRLIAFFFKKMESDRISREPIFLKALFLKILSEITGSCFNKREWVKKQFPDFLNSLII